MSKSGFCEWQVSGGSQATETTVSKGRKAGLPGRARPDDDEQVKSCTVALQQLVNAAVETENKKR